MACVALELPIVDFSKDAMEPGTKTWDLTRKQVVEALEEFGCFKATLDGISDELNNALFSTLEKFFDLPEETKSPLKSEDMPIHGYASDLPKIPLHEALGIKDPLNFSTFQNLSLRIWPQGDPAFCETLHSYAMRLSKLDVTIRKMVFESYNVEKYFESESKTLHNVLRIMKYRAPMTDEPMIGVGTHHDKSVMNILHSDGDGLQVRTKDGKWISTTPSGSSFVVMAGETFHGWSNGRLWCPLHKVEMSGTKPRYSIGFFTSKDGKVEIPSELVDEKHPLLFKPFGEENLLKHFMHEVKKITYNINDEYQAPAVTTHYAM